MSDERRLQHDRAVWDAEAASFDDEPDHGLRDPTVRAAWKALLQSVLPPVPGRLLDIGCGTGSLSVLLAELGWDVTGFDLSPAMISQAETKATAAGHHIRFVIGDAASPALAPASFDALVCRHLLWALPKPEEVLKRWNSLVKPGGRILLVEGFWHTGAGLHADDLLTMLPDTLTNAGVQPLSGQTGLWGKPVGDERYVLFANRRA